MKLIQNSFTQRVLGHEIPGCFWVLLILLCVFTFTSQNFFTGSNLINVANQATFLLLLALPMTFVIMTEGLDLSLGAQLSLSTVIFALVVKSSGSVSTGVSVCIAIGIVIGIVNGSLIGLLGVPPFVATLGTMGMITGIALLIAEESDLIGLNASAKAAWSGVLFGLPVPVLIAIFTYGLFYFLRFYTRFGVSVIALGGNTEALRLAGLRVAPRLLLVYGLASIYASIAGVLLASRIDGGNPTAAQGMEFDAIAAVVVGGTHFVKGRGSLFGTMLGVILITVLRNGLNLLALPTSIQVAAIGVLVIAALAMETRR